MIDIIIIVIFVIAFLLFDFVKLHDEVRMIIYLILLNSLFFYVALSVENGNVSKIFLVLSVVLIIYIPFSIVYKYGEKIWSKLR